jgi:hypothetical protein
LSASSLDNKSAWVARVLGVAVGGNGGASSDGSSLDWPSLRAAFDEAVSSVDEQIAALQTSLKNSGDDTLEEIAEFGMNGITGNHRVPLMATMIEIDQGGSEAVRISGPKLAKLATEFKAYLDSDERVGVCDDNPFGVPVSIRATLGGALGRLATELQKGVR